MGRPRKDAATSVYIQAEQFEKKLAKLTRDREELIASVPTEVMELIEFRQKSTAKGKAK